MNFNLTFNPKECGYDWLEYVAIVADSAKKLRNIVSILETYDLSNNPLLPDIYGRNYEMPRAKATLDVLLMISQNKHCSQRLHKEFYFGKIKNVGIEGDLAVCLRREVAGATSCESLLNYIAKKETDPYTILFFLANPNCSDKHFTMVYKRFLTGKLNGKEYEEVVTEGLLLSKYITQEQIDQLVSKIETILK